MEKTATAAATSVVMGGVLLLIWWTWRIVKWIWLKPKMLERCLRKQGISGTPYTFLVGDIRKEISMVKETTSKPISLSDDIAPRIAPFLLKSVKDHGKTSFVWMGPTPKVTIMKPELVKEVFNKIDDFHKPPMLPTARFVATGLATYDGEKWSKHRKIVNPAFHIDKLKKMVPAFYESCVAVINEWERLASDHHEGSTCEVDVLPYILRITSDAISRTSFGSCYEEGKRIFKLQEEQLQLALRAIEKIFIPGWRFLPTKDNKRMKEIDGEVKGRLRGIIDKRLRAKEAGEAPKDDLLGILLDSNSGNAQEQRMSIEDVIEECRLFYFAGQDTTSVLLVWTMVLLSWHQEWQARAREEVLQVFGNNMPDFDGLGHLKIVTMILNEVLRLYPPGNLLNRATHKETKLGDMTIPAGVHIAIPMLLVHHDPDLWGEDVLEFKPERFADGISKATKNQLSFLPFAGGPRICPGQNFAFTEAKIVLSMILQKFSFELSPTYTHAPYLILTLKPQFGAHLILRKL